MSTPFVSVIIPMYNGAATIERTLQSVRGQSIAEIEIIVVDDGSRDAGPRIVAAHAARDPRVRLITQANGGVARARNRGIAEARADLLAFVDADDLWAEGKLERQAERLARGGPAVGLVYADYARIDEDDRIIPDQDHELWEGAVLERLCYGNFIGCGSSALVPRRVIAAVGGFEPALHDADAYGCEDLLFYCRVAERFEFGAVRARDIGYRQLGGRMSGNPARMLRSWIMVHREIAGRHPELRPALDTGLASFALWQLEMRLWRRRLVGTARSARQLATVAPRIAARFVLNAAAARLKLGDAATLARAALPAPPSPLLFAAPRLAE